MGKGAAELRASGGPAGDHSVQALLRFTTALGRADRTEPVANIVHGVDAVVERVSYTFSPRSNASSFAPQFGSGQTQLDPRDGAELDRIAADWHGMRELTIHVIGHSDPTPIAARNRGRFPDNYALSRARAQAVADYLQAALPSSRIEVEGRGADEPIAEGTDAASLARNRRVEIEVEGIRAVSAADWHVVTASADSPTLTTTGAFGGDTRSADSLVRVADRVAKNENFDPAQKVEVSTVLGEFQAFRATMMNALCDGCRERVLASLRKPVAALEAGECRSDPSTE